MDDASRLGRRLRRPLLMFVAVLVAGTLGYMLIEGWPFTDALYMVVTSVTTVGFREVQPLSLAGRWFTMGIVIAGLTSTWYILSVIVSVMVEGELGRSWGRRRLEQHIERHHYHYIVCGYGRLGRAVADELRRNGRDVIIVELAEAAVSEAVQAGFPAVRGDATSDDILRRGGVERAAALFACVATDADNVFVTLSAHALQPELPIIARALDAGAISKLHRAGAAHVISPYAMAGQHIAQMAMHPVSGSIVERLMEGGAGEPTLTEIQIAADANVNGLSVGDIRKRLPAVNLIALARDERVVTPLADDLHVHGGDVLVVLATSSSLAELVRLWSPLAETGSSRSGNG